MEEYIGAPSPYHQLSQTQEVRSPGSLDEYIGLLYAIALYKDLNY